MVEQTPVGFGDIKVSGSAKRDELAVPYKISPDDTQFFKAETGIDDGEKLKTHIINVQMKALKIFPYWCIREFLFLRLGMATLPEYKNVIKLGKERPDAILLDVGCFFGVDARKAIADGFPLKNTVITDLYKEFYELGHALFNTTPETYPLSFVGGNALDPNVLQIVPPFNEPPSTEAPDLTTLTSLNPLAGRCGVIYASNFFHLFSEESQLYLAKALAGLLSPEPGSMILGEHAGSWKKGAHHKEHAGLTFEMFQHSPESWSAMWDGEVFAPGRVRVNAKIVGTGSVAGFTYDRLQWSVVRL